MPESSSHTAQDLAASKAAVLIEALATNPARAAKIGKKGLSPAQLTTGRTLQAAAQALGTTAAPAPIETWNRAKEQPHQ